MSNTTVHELNKREMFDGMRAYHVSELAHKRDAINLLKSVFAGTITAYVAIIGVVIAPDLRIDDPAMYGWFAFAIILIISVLICWSTNWKISKDHDRYEEYLKEYARESKFLGLIDTMVDVNGEEKGIKNIAIDPTAGDGYRFTQRIVWAAGVSVVFLALVLTIIVAKI